MAVVTSASWFSSCPTTPSKLDIIVAVNLRKLFIVPPYKIEVVIFTKVIRENWKSWGPSLLHCNELEV
jgi:hypothetical protein